MSIPAAERSPVDPRPRGAREGAAVVLSGWRCTGCAHPLTQPVLSCPVCRGAVTEERFASEGEVWASTCLRVRVPGHEPPSAMAYLVLDGGPRILVHTQGDQALEPGTRARVVEVTPAGDLVAAATDTTDQEVAS